MDKVIYKYPILIQSIQHIKLPVNTKILCVQSQNNNAFIWALVHPENLMQERRFELFSTGETIGCDMGIDRQYIGTFQLFNGSYVGHLFERTD